jgi:hypothetical protein
VTKYNRELYLWILFLFLPLASYNGTRQELPDPPETWSVADTGKGGWDSEMTLPRSKDGTHKPDSNQICEYTYTSPLEQP